MTPLSGERVEDYEYGASARERGGGLVGDKEWAA
jgi:hypothetical protein